MMAHKVRSHPILAIPILISVKGEISERLKSAEQRQSQLNIWG